MPLKPFALILLICSFWPVWQWYFSRILDSSDEPWGLFALCTVVGMLLQAHGRGGASPPSNGTSKESNRITGAHGAPLPQVALPIVFMLGYITSLFIFPHLVQAVFMVLVVWSLIICYFSPPSWMGIMGLLLLSLPAISSLNFFLGYPLRLLISVGSAMVLRLLGFAVEQNGTMLVLNNQLISVDAPCSGVNMLWASAYLATVAMCLCRLSWWRSIVLSAFALILVIAANVVRVCGLSMFTVNADKFGAQFNAYEPIFHMGAGITLFLIVTCGIAFLSIKLRGPAGDAWHRPYSDSSNLLPLVLLSVVAGVVPFFKLPVAVEHGTAIVWPEVINGQRIHENLQREKDDKFAEGFPGQTKQFTDGTKSYVVRWIKSETRQLHPSSDCFRGMGYDVEFGPLVQMPGGKRWSSFIASKGKIKLKVLEQIHDENGNSWTDVSEWYWSASLGKSRGPWWDIVIAEPATD